MKDIKIKKISGAQVALYPIEGLKAVALDFRVRAGAWYEKGDKWGKAHLLEHMMFQGSEKFTDHDAMEVYKEEYGIWNNAWTGGPQIELALRMPAESISHGVNLANEMLFKMSIPETELIRQKKVVRQEYEDKVSRPGARFGKARMNQLYGEGHIYTRDGIGEPECFENVTREELLQYAKEMIVPTNMYIGVSGKFDEDEVVKLLVKILKDQGSEAEFERQKIKRGETKMIHIEPNMTTATVEMDWYGKGMEEMNIEKRVRAGIASYLFGGSGRSLLFKEIRERQGLAYSARSGVDFREDLGMFGVSTSVKRENVDRVIFEIKKLLNEFIEKPIEKEVFERGKKYLVMQRQMSYESAMGTAEAISNSLFWEGRIVTVEEYEKIAKKISEEEIREVLRELTENQEPSVGIMMSEDKK